MKTTNVDLAAYIALSGIEPEEVTLDRGNWVHYQYRDTEYVQALVQAFQSDAMVPVRAYADSRKRMKKLANAATEYYVPSRRAKSLRNTR